MRWGIFFSYFIEVHLFSLVGRSKPRSILFSTDFNGFSCWDLCSQKWCNFLLITLKFSTENWMIFYWSQLNSLLIITKYYTILKENALFSTLCSQIFYWFWYNSLLFRGTFSTILNLIPYASGLFIWGNPALLRK